MTQFLDRKARLNIMPGLYDALPRHRRSSLQASLLGSTERQSRHDRDGECAGPWHDQGHRGGRLAGAGRGPHPLGQLCLYHMASCRGGQPLRQQCAHAVYVVYTPEHAGSGSIDYERCRWAARRCARISMPIWAAAIAPCRASRPGRTTRFVVNGRLALGDIDLSRGTKLEVSLWSRNLFNEEHTFAASHATYAYQGDYGIFNQPRTHGLDATIRF